MTSAAIGVGAESSFNGRALAKTGAITTNSNQFYSNPPVVTISGGPTVSVADDTPTISGSTTVDVPASVTVTVGIQTLLATVQAGGAWSVSPAILANGTYAVTAAVADLAGNTGFAAQSLTIDTILPVVTINGGAARSTNDVTPTVGGVTDVWTGSIVTVTVGGQTLTALAEANGSWNITPDSLTEGVLTVMASVRDEAGNPGDATQALTLDTTAPTVTITGGATASTNDLTPTISGGIGNPADVGAMVAVTVARQIMTTTVQADRTWIVTAGTLANGPHNVTVSIVDLAGNVGTATQTLSLDTTAPAISITDGEIAATSDTTPMISGSTTVDLPATVTVTVDTQTLTAPVEAGGAWSVSPAILANGTYAVTAAVTDLAGNAASAAQSLTIDTIPPVATISSALLTNDATPTICGTADVGPGSIVTVTVGGQTLAAVVQEDGSWNIAPASLAEGVLTVVASVHDEAGNLASATQELTIDKRAPVVTITGGATVSTNDPTPVISGTTGDAGDVGAMVAVTVAGQTMPTTAQADRTWTVTAETLADGPHHVTVSIVDRAGNIGTATQTLTVDEAAVPPTVPPTVPPAAPLAMNPVGPKRIFDTRPGQSPQALHAVEKRRIDGAYELQVNVADLAGLVPVLGVGAVSLNVTATNSDAEGFITVYACGTREMVSSVNFTAGGTVANAVIAPVSADGAFCFFSNVAVDVVADINGWFPAGQAFTPVGPNACSTPDQVRATWHWSRSQRPRCPDDGMIEVQLTDLAGFVPALGVEAVSLNVTVVNPTASGFVTVYACGTRELVSSVNFESGQTVANAAIAPVSVDGKVCFYALAATDLVVDINGWFKASSGFSGTSPVRLLDTRTAESPDARRVVLKAKIGGAHPGGQGDRCRRGRPGDRCRSSVTERDGNEPRGRRLRDCVCVWLREEVSSLNYTLGQTVANAVIAPVSTEGKICLFSPVPTDVIVDLNGWFANMPT